MEFDFDKLITYKNANKAEIGKEYYFFDDIDDCIIQGDFSDVAKAKLEHIYKDYSALPFLTNDSRFTFMYPVEEPKKQYLTFNDMVVRWGNHPNEIYNYRDAELGIDLIGVITGFDYNSKTFFFCNMEVSCGDNTNNPVRYTIDKMTTMENEPLLKEE